MQTEFAFELPRGYVADGQVHRQGVMRLSTARDEASALGDAAVRANEAFLPIALLARVVTSLGSLTAITPEIIEGLFVVDLEYLQAFYDRINASEPEWVEAECPHCGQSLVVKLVPQDDLP